MADTTCSACGGDGWQTADIIVDGAFARTCPSCGGTGIMATDHNAVSGVMASGDVMQSDDEMSEQDRRAWDEDEADMARIARAWAEYDRDLPGS